MKFISFRWNQMLNYTFFKALIYDAQNFKLQVSEDCLHQAK